MALLSPVAGSGRAPLPPTGTSGRDASQRALATPPEAVERSRRSRPSVEAHLRPCLPLTAASSSKRWALRCAAEGEHERDTGMSAEEIEAAAGDAGNEEDGYRVLVRVYNLDRYGLAPMGAKLLKKEVDGIWHVAVAVHNCEFWYDHQVNQQDLSEVEFAFGFGPAYVYDLGRTRTTKEELERLAFGPLAEKYHIDSYDCFYHNCHHFANELCMNLNGRRIPQWCIDHGEQGLSEMGEANAALTRFVTNKIARIMMVSWGKYSKERFVQLTEMKEEEEEERARSVGQAAA
eukprot:evm.model.scf_1945.3 EVM.evm.TU.scf_1945.3   scf_1945:24268-25137(+)